MRSLNNLKDAKKEIEYRLNRAKYYDEGISLPALVEFLTELNADIDAEDIEMTVEGLEKDVAECEDRALSAERTITEIRAVLS